MNVEIPAKLRVTTHVNKGYALPFPCPVTALELDPQDIAHAMVDLLEEVWKNPKKKASEVRVAPVLIENYCA
jgi:DNA-binding LacI/PurR family transcriptional regulator